MKHLSAIIFLAFGLLTMPIAAQSFSDTDVLLSSSSLVQGGVILLTVKAGASEKPIVTWIDKEVHLVYRSAGASWHGFIAADLNQKAGIYEAVVQFPVDGFEKVISIPVQNKNYGVRKIPLPSRKLEIDDETLERVTKEAATVNELWDAACRPPAWNDPFVMPVDGKITGRFGKRTIINDRERAPHTGVDFRGEIGNPVRATHSGTVVLVADHFFTGQSIFLDHGGCIISMYFHLDKILVKDGDYVEKGQIIGFLGATGRATGPHLHFGVRVNGNRIDPLTLIRLSESLSKPD